MRAGIHENPLADRYGARPLIVLGAVVYLLLAWPIPRHNCGEARVYAYGLGLSSFGKPEFCEAGPLTGLS